MILWLYRGSKECQRLCAKGAGAFLNSVVEGLPEIADNFGAFRAHTLLYIYFCAFNFFRYAGTSSI